MEDAYARSVSEVLDFFGVDPTKGLSDSQVVHHSRLYGRNGMYYFHFTCTSVHIKHHSGT
jgi:hypothetical protein